MREKNEVIMVYADAEFTDLGILQDYSFDECYGVDENTFECKIQKYNPALWDEEHPLGQDYILYIEFTEYGGFIDRIESDTKSGVVTLTGRTWHGWLNSFVIEPFKGQDIRSYQGEGNAVLTQILTDAGVPMNLIEVSDDDSGVDIPITEVRYKKAYDCIIKILTSEDVNAKLCMYYKDGKLHMQVLPCINNGLFEEFDTTQVPLKVGKTYNNVNDLVCMGQGNGADRAVIHLYMRDAPEESDIGKKILPYCKTNPMQDSDYYTDLDALSQSTDPEDVANYAEIMANMVTGRAKYADIYDFSSAEITTNYLKLDTKPDNWNGVYPNYYRRNGTEFEKVERVFKDEYHLTEQVYGYREPPDWRSNYKNYYQKTTNSSTELIPVQDLPVEQSAKSYRPNIAQDGYDGLQTMNSDWWRDHYGDYYEKVAQMSTYVFQRVQGVPRTEYALWDSTDPPLNWTTNYGNYYNRTWDGTQYQYSAISGVPKDVYDIQTAKPTDWSSNYGSYYYKATSTKVDKDTRKKIYKKGNYYTVSQGISWGVIQGYYYDNPKKKKGKHNFPKWGKKKYYTKKTHYDPPAYVAGTVFYAVSVTDPPTFVAGKYYSEVVDSTPTWMARQDGANAFGGYYKLYPNVEQIPKFEAEEFFRAVQDRFKVLIENALERYAEISDKDTLDIELELDSNYDVGDYICGMDEVTGTTKLDTTKMIRRKIIKIKKGILSIDYEVD